jgi:hypothetical protein
MIGIQFLNDPWTRKNDAAWVKDTIVLATRWVRAGHNQRLLFATTRHGKLTAPTTPTGCERNKKQNEDSNSSWEQVRKIQEGEVVANAACGMAVDASNNKTMLVKVVERKGEQFRNENWLLIHHREWRLIVKREWGCFEYE